MRVPTWTRTHDADSDVVTGSLETICLPKPSVRMLDP